MIDVSLEDWAGTHQLIVLDGCDGVGKTTLATRLANRHGHLIVHATLTPEGTDLNSKYHDMINYPWPLVLDCCFISELVYGPLERGRSRLTFDEASRLAAEAAQRGGILVHVTGKPEQISARLQARDGDAPKLSHIKKLTTAYADVFAQLADYAPVITIDTTAASA